jgi:hypothetical protein
MSDIKSLPSHPKHPALRLSGRHAAARGLTRRPVWRCATRYHLTAAQSQYEALGV